MILTWIRETSKSLFWLLMSVVIDLVRNMRNFPKSIKISSNYKSIKKKLFFYYQDVDVCWYVSIKCYLSFYLLGKKYLCKVMPDKSATKSFRFCLFLMEIVRQPILITVDSMIFCYTIQQSNIPLTQVLCETNMLRIVWLLPGPSLKQWIQHSIESASKVFLVHLS